MNRAFHFAIYRQAGSAVLLPIIESLWLQFGLYLRAASERFDGAGGRGSNHHCEMLAALTNGDASAARSALEADIGRSFDRAMQDEALWARRDGAA
jgi:DNA-binding GntR family transcriptional regulator